MDRVERWTQRLAARALDGLAAVPGITVYGPRNAARRTPLVAFRLAGRDPVSVAAGLGRAGIESGAGGDGSSLAHHALGLHPPASVRLSFCLYNTPAEVDRAVAAVAAIAAGPPAARRQRRGRPGRARPVPAGTCRHPPGARPRRPPEGSGGRAVAPADAGAVTVPGAAPRTGQDRAGAGVPPARVSPARVPPARATGPGCAGCWAGRTPCASCSRR